MGVNRVIILGRLGRDPEMKSNPEGLKFCKFSLAVSEKWADKAGQRQEKTEWINCTAWGKTAEICGKYLKKGSETYVEGKFVTTSWEGENGKKLYASGVSVEIVQLIGGAPQGNRAPHAEPSANDYHRDNTSQFTSEDIPF